MSTISPLLPPMAAPMMTLAALAATAPVSRPSGETVALQEARILAGINGQLANPGLATQSQWSAVWLALSQDRANLAYIATNSSTNSFAVVFRGTWFDSLVDLAEDMNVGSPVQFTAGGGTPLLISQGAMEAFSEITNAVYVPDEGTPTTLLQALQALLSAAPSSPAPTVYIAGHSLGGAMATTAALYLFEQTWTNRPTFAVFTFAAPTAGLQAFADFYDAQLTDNPPQSAWRIYNAWDVVPNAWATLSTVESTFYPSPGPAQGVALHQMLEQIANATNGNVYVQTNQGPTTTIELNTATYGDSGSVFDADAVCTTTGDFFAQLAYQHSNNVYLQLMGAATVPTLEPTVTAISPNNGPTAGGTTVTITGTGFVAGSGVDFGTVAVPATDVTIVSDTEITATAPPCFGIVDVRVTNVNGTSAVTPSDQFAAPSPLSAPVVMAISPYAGTSSALSPSSGPAAGGTVVSISGTGFITGSTVSFGSTPATDVTVVSLTRIVATSPAGTGSVSVTVTNSLGTSAAAGGVDQFTYSTAVVTGADPCCGPAKNGAAVTITGAGFEQQCTVSFGSKPSTSVQYVSSTQVTAVPPNVTIVGGVSNQVVDVVVQNPGSTPSALTSADRYTYYPS